MRKAARLLALGIAAILAAAVLYYGYDIYRARQYTRDVLIPRIRSTDFALQLSDLPPRRLDILLKVEDPSFYRHGGVDLTTPGAGITTITQGLVKQLYFERFRPGVAKLRQTLIAAFVLDPLVSKDDQLRLFVNSVYLGRQASGFHEAARVYHGKPFAELTEDEYISLVAMIIAPGTFDPIAHPQRNAERVARIKRLVNGEYEPRGLFDLFYGRLDEETRQRVPPLSYFESDYE